MQQACWEGSGISYAHVTSSASRDCLVLCIGRQQGTSHWSALNTNGDMFLSTVLPCSIVGQQQACDLALPTCDQSPHSPFDCICHHIDGRTRIVHINALHAVRSATSSTLLCALVIYILSAPVSAL